MRDPFNPDEEGRLKNFYRVPLHLISKGGPLARDPRPLATYLALRTAGGVEKEVDGDVVLRASTQDLVQHSGHTRRTVIRHLQMLKDMGRIIEIGEPGKGWKREYRMPLIDFPGSNPEPMTFISVPRVFQNGNPWVQALDGYELLAMLVLHKVADWGKDRWDLPQVDLQRYQLGREMHRLTGANSSTCRKTMQRLVAKGLELGFMQAHDDWLILPPAAAGHRPKSRLSRSNVHQLPGQRDTGGCDTSSRLPGQGDTGTAEKRDRVTQVGGTR
jgi:hypothetical protein